MSMMEDYDALDPSDLIINEQRRTEARTLSALNDSPDDAARAEQLSRATGENPALVFPNLEERERNHKATLTSQLLNNNQFLRSYIDAHPLADKVSNDDYGQLDAVSASMWKLPMPVRKFSYNLATGIEHSIGLTAEGLGYLFGAEGTKGAAERMKAKTIADVSGNKGEEQQFKESEQTIPGMVGQGVGGLIGLAPAMVAGLPGVGIQMGLQGGAEARNRAAAAGADEQTQATAFTTGFAINSILGVAPLHLLGKSYQAAGPGALSWSTAKLKDAMQFGGIFAGFGEVQHGFNEWAASLLYDPKAAYHPDFNRVVSSFILGGMLGGTFNKVKPYVEAGQEIPPGAHPIVDQAKAKQAEIDIDNLDNALKEAAKSATRERSPELFKIFMQQHTDAKIGLSADAIVKMYGEKEPLFDDNKLGWVPNIKEQLAVARETGGDVEIPLADWLAHVDPALAKELHDDVRVRPNGLTIREGTAVQEQAVKQQQQQQQQPLKTEVSMPEPSGPFTEVIAKAREVFAKDKGFSHDAEYIAREVIKKNFGDEAETVFRGEINRLVKETVEVLQARSKSTALEGVPMVEAWHASPHTFDAFDMSKVGTGEGAQSYGHGLYVAESEKVSGPGGEYHRRFGGRLNESKALADPELGPRLKKASQEFNEAALDYEEYLVPTKVGLDRSGTERARARYERADRALEEIKAEALTKYSEGANSYRVRIHAEKDQFLDWDADLAASTSGKKVLADLESKHPELFDALEEMLDSHGQPSIHDLTGTQLYQLLGRYASEGPLPGAKGDGSNTKAEASEFLKSLGIPGIRYLDQGSRQQRSKDIIRKEIEHVEAAIESLKTVDGAEAFEKLNNVDVVKGRSRFEDELKGLREELAAPEPTYNYVIFDEKLIEIVDRNGEAIQAVRAQAGLEPLAQAGDLTLKLKESVKEYQPPDEAIAKREDLEGELSKYKTMGAENLSREQMAEVTRLETELDELRTTVHAAEPVLVHKYELVSRRGLPVAELDLTYLPEKKEVYVSWIGGKANKLENVESSVNAFGPGTIRDVLRQVRAAFPEAETISGQRISGARGKVSEDTNGAAFPTAKISLKQPDTVVETALRKVWTDEGIENAADALEGKVVEHAPGLKVVEPTGELTPHEADAVQKANEVLERILPAVTKVPARLISFDGRGVQGVFQQYTDRIPTILYLMDPAKAVHTVRHEAIHFLRREGFFSKGEWDTLRQAAIKEGWIEHYSIGKRYADENLARMLEEAVAERYADWADGNKHGQPEVNTIMGKIKNLAFNIVQEVKKALPHNMTVEELFQKIESGEIGRREGTKPLDKSAFKGAAQEMAPGAEAAQRQLFAKANAIGMTVVEYQRHMRNIKKLQEEDVAAQMARAEAFERKKQTKEWKADEARIREEVTNDIQFRPDIAAATFFTEGRLYDTIKNQSPKLDASLVDPEMAKRLPKELLIKKGGINPDDIAPLFGYQTGKEMVSKLVEMAEARGELPFKEFVKGIVDDEVGQRMLREHGMLEENILKAAQEHVVGDTQMDILHEEFIGLGMKSKLLENPFTKEQVKAWVSERFESLPTSTIKIDKFLSEAGKAGRDAELKMLIGKWDEAFQQKQRQYVAMLLAREAKQLEKEQDRFDKTAKRFSARKIENVEQSYTDYVQALLSLAGMRVRRSDKEIAESIEAFGTGSLEAFVQRKGNEGWELAISDNIQQKNIKPIEQMNVAEFREFKEAIDSLAHVGREEKKIIIGEEKRNFDEVKQEIIDNITQLPERSKKHPERLLYMLDATLVKMEEVAKDLDLRKQAGPMFKALILPLMHAKRIENDMLKKLSAEFAGIKEFAKDWKKTLDDAIPNDALIDPKGEVPFDLTRKNMINIMLNFGNRSNIQKFTEGYGGKKGAAALEARLWQMFDQHAKKEDWQFVQKIWDLFETLRGDSDAMYRRISGVPPKWIEVQPISTQHGEFAGGYFPILYDKFRSNIGVIEDKAAPANSTFGSDYFKATTGAGYAKARSGYIDYVQFQNSLEQVAGRMQQMIHDVSHREAVMSVGKIVYNREIRGAMRDHYGTEYTEQLHPWLRDIANSYNANEQAIGFWNNLMARARGNLVAHALGFNARVILSPNLGMFNPNQARKFYSDYTFNRDMVMSKSEEIPHTLRSLDRDFREKLDSTINRMGWSGMQAKAFEISMWPALQLEQQARMIGFMTKYNRGIRKGLSEADAVAEADNAVRAFHGAAGTIDLPAIMRGNEAMKVATVFYGFFNTMYNWQRHIPGNIRRGEFMDAFKNVYGAVLIPAAFGALLFNQQKESDPWFKTWGKALLQQPLSTVPILREASSYFLEGFPPRSPIESIMNAAGSIISDVKKYKEGKPIAKPITHAANVIGLTAGLPLAQIGRTAQFTSDVMDRKQRPRNVQEWIRGVISGEAKLKP